MRAIDLDGHWLWQANVTQVLGLFDCRKGIEDVFAIDTVVAEGIDGEIADSEAREVLEEMRALAWIHLEVLEPCLDDDTCRRDMWPLDWNTEPRVAASPASGTDEQILLIALKELAVHPVALFCNDRVEAWRIAVVASLDIDDVRDVGYDAVTNGTM